MTALAERIDVTPEGELIELPQPAAPLTLFGTTDPAAVVQRASTVATALAGVINERNLFKRIRDRDHIYVEAWTLLGSMLGVFATVEWSRPVEDGWEARVTARTINGALVGAAEAMCTRSESTWKSREDHALRSMAQTRAVSKALRMPLGFIIELAGYSATPAEEMDGIEQPEPRGPRPASRDASHTQAGSLTSAPAPDLRAALADAMKAHNINLAALERIADDLGVPKGTKANDEQLRAMLARIEQPVGDVPTSALAEPGQGTVEGDGEGIPVPVTTPSSEAATSADRALLPPESDPPAAPTDAEILAAAGPGAEIVPPAPGTAEYRALPNGTERAKAKAYWDAEKKKPAGQIVADMNDAP